MASTTPQGIFKSMNAIMCEIGSVSKDQKNQSQGFMFRGIDDVYNRLHPIMSKHGVFSVPEVLEERREDRTTRGGSAMCQCILKVRYRFFASDGSSVESTVMGEGADMGDKAATKAMAIAHKYALLQTFCIPTDEDKDPDIESHEFTPKPKIDLGPLVKRAKEKALTAGQMTYILDNFYNVAHSSELTQEKLDDLMTLLGDDKTFSEIKQAVEGPDETADKNMADPATRVVRKKRK